MVAWTSESGEKGLDSSCVLERELMEWVLEKA